MFAQSSFFTTANVGQNQLIEGNNTIVLAKSWGWCDIDYIQLVPYVPINNATLEAEEGTLSGVEIETSRPGFSGTGYVTSFDNDTDKLS